MLKEIDETIGLAATRLAKEIEANSIILVEKNKDCDLNQEQPCIECSIIVFRKKEKDYLKNNYKHKIKNIAPGNIFPVKEIVMESISRDLVKKNDRVVCIVDESIGLGFKGLIFIFDVDKILFNMSVHNLGEYVDPHVIESIIDIALEIIKEGREGRKIGTGFLIGDKNEINRYTKQLIINPFNGYPEEERNITDPLIRETIKEFSQLDGIFVIDKNGTIISGGSYIDIDTEQLQTLNGLGTRHRNCAAVTRYTNSIAVVVSSSGGKITIFKDGKLIKKTRANVNKKD